MLIISEIYILILIIFLKKLCPLLFKKQCLHSFMKHFLGGVLKGSMIGYKTRRGVSLSLTSLQLEVGRQDLPKNYHP